MLGYISLNWGNNYRFGYEQRYRLKPNKLYYINMLNSHYKSWESIWSHLYNYEKCLLPKLDMRGCSFCVAFLSTIYTKVNVHLITYNRLWIKRFRIIDKYKQFNVLFHVINEGIGCRKKLIAVFTRIYYAMQATFNMFFTLRPWGELSIWLNICINVSLLIW